MMTALQLTELTAAAFGVLGTVLLALNGRRAGWGFVAYLASNAGWIAFAWAHSHWGLLAQQVAFTASSLLGVWVWLIKPHAAATSTVLPSLKQRYCSHRFALDDLTMVNRNSAGNDRVSWTCDKCGKVFTAQCGLDISPRHGPTFQRKPQPNEAQP